MKIYNEDKTQELVAKECDLSLGCLKTETEVIHHEAQEEQEEQGHYEIVAEYENGGQDIEWIVDVPGIEGHEAYDETIQYQIYHLYTEAELEIIQCDEQIAYHQNQLLESDFKAIKYAEGLYSEEEYAPIKQQRQMHRQTINELNARIRELSRQSEKAQDN